jgi:hypothetical protein
MKTTEIRAQPLRATVGALAAELARLDEAAERKRKELVNMGAMTTPTGDDLVRALAQEVALEEQRIAAKREALARAEAALRTQQRDAEAADEARRAAREQALRDAFLAANDRRVEKTSRAETLGRKFIAALAEQLAAQNEFREAAKAITRGERVGGGVSLAAADNDKLIKRTSGRMSSLLRTLLPRGVYRFGDLTLLTNDFHPASEDWVAAEDAEMAALVRALT